MSDGDDATPGHRGGSVGDNTNQRLTRRPRPPIAAAPWERGGVRQAIPHRPDSEGGHHTDGISVAELIAKMAGDAGNGRGGMHYGVDDHEPAHESAYEDAATDLIPVVTGPDTPDLDAARRRKAEALLRGENNGQTTVLPAADGEVGTDGHSPDGGVIDLCWWPAASGPRCSRSSRSR